MKFLALSLIANLFFITNILTIDNKMQDHYTTVEKLENIEIRKYQKLIYVSNTPLNDLERNNSFKEIANYIFGDNDSGTKIEMTSPVVIKLHNKNEMAFIMPKRFNLNNLPITNNKKLRIYEEPSSLKATISYSGYSNKEKEEKYISILKKKLNEHNILHKNDFEVLIYNSPYKFFNRKNEIVVTLKNYQMKKENKNSELNKIYLGGGCFWCVEAIFEDVIGVENVISGYSGGKIKNPSYKEVSRGMTEHAEVCEIHYNSKIISLTDILKIFFLSHDPTTLNRQGNDIGSHYRSIILYKNQDEKNIIKEYIKKIDNEIFDDKIVTELKKFEVFYKAEDYHQNYFKQNSSQQYCSLVISPKINKAKKQLKEFYK